MESCKCPITQEVFTDPVIGDDGHTYERTAIIEWLKKNGTSPITGQPMSINSLRTNFTVKTMIEELKSVVKLQQIQYQFQLDVDIRKTRSKPIFQAFGKMLYEVEWINRTGPPIILLKIAGAKATQEASFYVQLSCHPYIVRTLGLVQGNTDSIMLLQECAPCGDLCELLQENGFKPNERVLLSIFEQICDAMVCLVDNGIVHGDLACRNVLVFQYDAIDPDKNLVKLTDFGLTIGSKLYSIVDSASMSTMTIIPVRYAAPEILRDPNKSNYSEKSDVYSMGVLMWEACSYGELPYSSSHDDNDVRRRKLNDERLQQPSSCNHELWKILNDCWHPDSKNRPTFKNLKRSLLTVQSQLLRASQQQVNLQSNPNLTQSTTNEDHISTNNVYIPCELCNKQIDLRYWSAHTQDCREREIHRIAALAETISRTLIEENIPCEYCEELISAEQHRTHEVNCRKNPYNIVQPAEFVHSQTFPINDSRKESPNTKRNPTWLPSAHSLYEQPSSRNIFSQLYSYRPSHTKTSNHAPNNTYNTFHKPWTEDQPRQNQDNCTATINTKSTLKPQAPWSPIKYQRIPLYSEQTPVPPQRAPTMCAQSFALIEQTRRDAGQFLQNFEQSPRNFEEPSTHFEPIPRYVQHSSISFEPLPRNAPQPSTFLEPLSNDVQRSAGNAEPLPMNSKQFSGNMQQRHKKFK